MNKFDNAQKNITTVLTIWIIICIVTLTIVLLPQLQQFNKYITIGFVSATLIFASITTFYVKKLLKKASTTESQLNFLSSGGNTEKLATDADSSEEAKQEKLRQEKQAKEKRIAEENKQLDAITQQITADLDQTADLNEYFDHLLSNFAKIFDIVQGVAYVLNTKTNKYEIKSTYAFYTPDTDRTFEIGEGITGQVAKDKKTLQIDNIPENYIKTVVSGLGQGTPKHLIFLPFVFGKQTIALVELATFEKKNFNLNLLSEKISNKITKTIADNLNLSE